MASCDAEKHITRGEIFPFILRLPRYLIRAASIFWLVGCRLRLEQHVLWVSRRHLLIIEIVMLMDVLVDWTVVLLDDAQVVLAVDWTIE